jgi:hypothetical protein
MAVAVILVSCKEDGSDQNKNGKKDSVTVNAAADTTKHSVASISPIVTQYLALKNALVVDDAVNAAKAGDALLAALNAMDLNSVPADKQKEYKEISEDAQENAEHIGKNAGKIDHQREHFASLSKDVNDMVSLLGAPETLYQDHCPMYEKGKGAIWLSEAKEIKNPYFGKKMQGCGSLQKELK